MDISRFKPLDPIFCPQCEKEMVVPAVLGGYRLNRFLGEGAMGRVYLAHDPNLGRDVAVKILREDLKATPAMWSVLESEAKAAAGISNVHVIQVFKMGKVLGRPYIVMELADYASLEDIMQDGPIDETSAIRIAIDVMTGLNAAYQIHLLHGDVKPANILITSNGMAKVADFGLARFMQEGQTVERWGTPYYIAPEKSRQIQEDFRSDMYSLGATLFHALAGRAPFEGQTGEEVIAKSLRERTPRLHRVTPDLSRNISELVHQMMRQDPDLRFGSYPQAIACFELLRDGLYRPGLCREHRAPRAGRLRKIADSLSRLVVDQP
jgi:serine/threonine protein kinase